MLSELSLSGEELLEFVREESRNKRKLRRSSRQQPEASRLAHIINSTQRALANYIGQVDRHITAVPLQKHFTDRELLTSREQYYLYMIEFELVNRSQIEQFSRSNFKIALLPYCLKESHTDCKARPDEIDYQCKGCLKTCYINRMGKILKKQNIHPYILSRGRVTTLLKEVREKHGSTGVIGIACMVELVMGMRLCMNAGLPVLGIPLNANRCPRWMGSMHDTSVDLQALENLISA